MHEGVGVLAAQIQTFMIVGRAIASFLLVIAVAAGCATAPRATPTRQLAEARLAGTVSPAPVGPSESFLARLYRADRRKRGGSPVWRRMAGLSD